TCPAIEQTGPPGTRIQVPTRAFLTVSGARSQPKMPPSTPKGGTQMEAQKRYAQVPQSVVLVVLLGTLFIGGVGGYAVRAAESSGAQAADANRTLLIPRAAREGLEITPVQAPASRSTHADATSKRSRPN